MSALEQHRNIVLRSNKYFKQLGLQPFILTLPLRGATAEMNKKGIRDKILKNKSYIVTEHNQCDGEVTRQSPESLRLMQTMIDNLTSETIVGFVLVVAQVLPDQDYRPVAGAVVELLDDHERSIRGLWCRRSLPPDLVKVLLKATIVRLFAHAFELTPPGAQRVRNSNKLVSTLDSACISFPREACDFLTVELAMSKHWETETDGGRHNDHPSLKCTCRKLSCEDGAWQFWGISETRFLKVWKTHSTIFVPDEVPTVYRNYFEFKNQASVKDTAASAYIQREPSARCSDRFPDPSQAKAQRKKARHSSGSNNEVDENDHHEDEDEEEEEKKNAPDSSQRRPCSASSTPMASS